jgi:C-terminal processing protease CtpA/Prc
MRTSIFKVAAIATALISPAHSTPTQVVDAHSQKHHRAQLPKKAPGPPPLNCDDPSKGQFDSVREYSCAYSFFHDYSSMLVDAAKMKEFERLWNPAILAQSPELKMIGVSNSNRKALTFSLIRRMRDFTHERFDYVQDQDDVEAEDKTDVHPVLEGGIGVNLVLENDWQIEQSIFAAAPADGISLADYRAKKNALAVVSPIHRVIVGTTTQDSPADGVLQNDDIIVAIDGVPVEGMSFDSVAKDHIHGTDGTSVSLEVLRKSSSDPKAAMQHLTFHLTRSKFDERAVSVKDIDGVRHITIDNFVNGHLLGDYRRALLEAQTQHLKGVDVNLRDNPGGRLDYVLGMLEMVVPRGLLLTSREREQSALALLQKDYTMLDGFALTVKHSVGKADPGKAAVFSYKRVSFSEAYEKAAREDPGYIYEHPLLPVIDDDLPVVVSINVDSYSASEIFAGAIQATHRGAVVGMPSAGKGAIMIEVPLPEGGRVSVTDGQFYPGGIDTKYKGILPDYEIDQASDYGKTDAQQDKAGAVIEEAHKRLQAFKDEASTRVKINGDRFEKEMSERDADDNKPVIVEDVPPKH